MNPAFLLAQAKRLVHQFQQNYGHLQQDQQRLSEELEALSVERQKFITHTRRELMNEVDFTEQLGELTAKEVGLKRRLAAIEQEIDAHANMDWEEQVNIYMADLQAGVEELNNAAPKTPEERHHVFC